MNIFNLFLQTLLHQLKQLKNNGSTLEVTGSISALRTVLRCRRGRPRAKILRVSHRQVQAGLCRVASQQARLTSEGRPDRRACRAAFGDLRAREAVQGAHRHFQLHAQEEQGNG